MSSRPAFSICVSSPPDREFLVAEVFVDDEQLAEINREDGTWTVELYARHSGEAWRLPLSETLRSLEAAKQRLE